MHCRVVGVESGFDPRRNGTMYVIYGLRLKYWSSTNHYWYRVSNSAQDDLRRMVHIRDRDPVRDLYNGKLDDDSSGNFHRDRRTRYPAVPLRPVDSGAIFCPCSLCERNYMPIGNA